MNLDTVINYKFKYHVKRLIKNCVHLFKMLIKRGYYSIIINISISAIKNLLVFFIFFFSFLILQNAKKKQRIKARKPSVNLRNFLYYNSSLSFLYLQILKKLNKLSINFQYIMTWAITWHYMILCNSTKSTILKAKPSIVRTSNLFLLNFQAKLTSKLTKFSQRYQKILKNIWICSKSRTLSQIFINFAIKF